MTTITQKAPVQQEVARGRTRILIPNMPGPVRDVRGWLAWRQRIGAWAKKTLKKRRRN